MEAEIIALARCCCKLLPVMDIVKEKGDAIGLATKDLTTIHVSMQRIPVFWMKQILQSLLQGASTMLS